jgi:hypothetical protein
MIVGVVELGSQDFHVVYLITTTRARRADFSKWASTVHNCRLKGPKAISRFSLQAKNHHQVALATFAPATATPQIVE